MAGEAMTTKEAAQQIGCTSRTVVNLIQSGKLPAKLYGHSYVIDQAALRRYLARQAVKEEEVKQEE
jgi:excisionase family DNA binding protein